MDTVIYVAYPNGVWGLGLGVRGLGIGTAPRYTHPK